MKRESNHRKQTSMDQKYKHLFEKSLDTGSLALRANESQCGKALEFRFGYVETDAMAIVEALKSGERRV